ncbi:MAG: aminotransferase class I/II-fold pyridoxal phosphate-dependent enzyme, partial [Gammaproteobacteria bacterium]|nr:aminotransferase class I/II-fold pyridoxal phosphate-dependent enzyme [Gammaproteobacteria bacterium]
MQFIDLKSQQARIRDSIDRRLAALLDHGQYILGPEVTEMEHGLAAYVGVQHCVSAASGTDALLLALMALDIGPGDEVITSPFSFIATAEVIALVGATPVFVDVDPVSYNLDPGKLEAAIGDRTRAIMPVSLFGLCADMDAINAIA